MESPSPPPPAPSADTPPAGMLPSGILRLPVELRLHIFEHAFHACDQPNSLFISHRTYLWGRSPFPRELMNYLLICKQLHHDLRNLTWEKVLFRARPESGYGYEFARYLGDTGSCAVLKKIRHLEILFPFASREGHRLETDLERVMKPCMDFVRQSETLRSVTFNCDTSLFGVSDKTVRVVVGMWVEVLRARWEKVALSATTKGEHGPLCIELFTNGGLEMVAE